MLTEKTSITSANGTWVVRAGGAVIGESTEALSVVRGDAAEVIYFPRNDIGMAFLEASDYRTTAAGFGEASHFHIITKSRTLENAAYSYDAPEEDAQRLAGYIAFVASDTVAVEQV